MKTKLLLLTFLGFIAANAQTTHNLDWYMGVGSNLDLTIDVGDTVMWTWADPLPHTVENEQGNSVETFDSGVITGEGETYSHTFTEVGANRYFCGIHGAGGMSGTITVNEVLGVGDTSVNTIEIYPNPTSSIINVVLPKNMREGQITVFDILGKNVYTKEFKSAQKISMNISNWNTGSYFMKIVSNGKTQIEKFIKD